MADWFEEVREEVHNWSVENFTAEQPAENPLVGAGEESGELACSILKRAQGIDDSEKYEDREDVGDEAEIDALGDIAIYYMDFIGRLQDERTDNPKDGIYHMLEFYSKFGDVCEAVVNDETEDIEQLSEELINSLDELAESRGHNLDHCVKDTWYNEVKDRDWDSDLK